MTPTPRTPAPTLDVPLVGGGSWSLADRQPEAFTLVAFYRGYHCPKCKAQLREYDERYDEIRAAGLDVVAVSGDDAELAGRTVEEWGISRLPVGYGLGTEDMRRWGLYVSKAVKEGEPDEFGEPGLFLVQPDGTLYAAMVQSWPFARPHLDNLLNAVGWVLENDYPARGEA